MKNVFISYVKEDSEKIDVLYHELTSYGLNVWLDKHSISPGQRWKDSIRKAIKQGDYFIACFSKSYMEKGKSYMNEELNLAIDILRMYPSNIVWFIPVRLDECDLPDITINSRESIQDIQFIDLFVDWERNIKNLIRAINPIETYFQKLYTDVQENLFSQINKISKCTENNVKGELVKIALIGNSGIGKSAIANYLGGQTLYEEDDFTAVTEVVREYKLNNVCKIVDCPISYIFSDNKKNQIIKYINENIDFIIHVINTSARGRIFGEDYELFELIKAQNNIPYMVLLNKIDYLNEESLQTYLEKLITFLNIPVFPVSAYKKTNMNTFKELVFHVVNQIEAMKFN